MELIDKMTNILVTLFSKRLQNDNTKNQRGTSEHTKTESHL